MRCRLFLRLMTVPEGARLLLCCLCQKQMTSLDFEATLPTHVEMVLNCNGKQPKPNQVVAKRIGARGKEALCPFSRDALPSGLETGLLVICITCMLTLDTKPAFKVWNRNWYSLSASLRSMVKWPRSHLICMMYHLLFARFNTDVLILLWHDNSKGPLKSVWACIVFQHDFLLHNYSVCLSFICLSHFPSVRVLILNLFFSC